MIPAKLRPNDEVRVVSPSSELGFVSGELRGIAAERLRGLGLWCSFGGAGEVLDRFESSPIKDRVSELHAAFADPEISGMLTVIGGYNSNQLLGHLDYDLIRENPKVLCGYSNITALATAIHARTGLVTYYGPHFSTFAMQRGIQYTLDYFGRCIMQDDPYDVQPTDHWSDDAWYVDQENRDFVPNSGYAVVNEGEAEGTLLGGHLSTLCLLPGTSFMPDLDGSILLFECDDETKPHHLDRELQSLVHQPGFEGVRGIVFGRFQKASNVDHETLTEIIHGKPDLDHIPVVSDASFGHTTPQFTFPIGGTGSLRARGGDATIRIEAH